MPESENSKTRKPRQKTTAKKAEETPDCHIHDKVFELSVNEIRKKVCVNDEPLTEFEGKYYCLFHLPTKNKDIEKFRKFFQARLEKVDKQCSDIEAGFPGDKEKQDRVKNERNISYDFSYVWFPIKVYLPRKFSSMVDFSYATFSTTAYFMEATFSTTAYFSDATFSAEANFWRARFLDETHFERIKFSKTEWANFTRAKFDKDVYFAHSAFNNEVSFESAIFGSDSYVLFLETFFAGNADFRFCTADGYLQFSKLRLEDENVFDFQEAAFEKASRISFHTVRLRPNWFLNIDSRKFVFTDIDWRNLDYERGNKNIERELAAIEARGIKEQKKRLLEIAARQLAVNAEENNRYEEAAKFRYLAMETKRLEEGKFYSRFLYTLYKWTSGYGESWSWAAFVLLIILLGFGVFYDSPFANFEPLEKKTVNISADNVPKPEYYKMNNAEGFVYSLYVAALQRPEPKAADTLTRFFIILETIFAPLQVALLALAIRRKFMR